MLAKATGVTMTTMKLKIQLALKYISKLYALITYGEPHLVASAFVGARIFKGTISAG